MDAEPLILAAAGLLIGGVLLSKTSSRFGVPSLVLFLALGMLAGSDGLLGIEFEDFELSRSFGIIALTFILFSGGLGTRWQDIRPVLAPGLVLASVGVLITALILGGVASMILPISLQEGMLLGAIIASTDSAAVFSILRSRGVNLRARIGPMLELESGSNDPTAVFATVGVISVIEDDSADIAGLLASFVVQMTVGIVAGLVLARIVVFLINRLHLEFDGLYPVLTFAFVLLLFEGVTFIQGSGFLAVYVAGVTMANDEFLHRRSLIRFHDAIAWLAQIAMFVLLGLLAFPSELLPIALRALALAAVLMFLARPVAVLLALLPFRVPLPEITLISWVGLRGATPIILATFPAVEGIDGSETIFHVVFFVVLTSVLVQGTTVTAAARRLGLVAGPAPPEPATFDMVITGDTGHHLHEVMIPPGAQSVGSSLVELGLPRGVLVVLLRRGDTTTMPQGGTVLQAGDELLVLTEEEPFEAVRSLFDGDEAS